MPDFREGIGDETGRKIVRQQGYLEWRYAPGKTVEIVNLEVSNYHRREGVGRSMVNELLEEVAEHDTKSVYVFTTLTNRIAHDFYNAMGFVREATVPEFYADQSAVFFCLRVK